MDKKGWDMKFIAKMTFVLFAFLVILFVYFGKDQLFAKSVKPIGETAGGLSSDCDNDGKVDTIDPCPCNANIEPNEEGKGCDEYAKCKEKLKTQKCP